MAEFSSSTGIALRVARQARGLTQQQLAGMAGVTRQPVSAFESGVSDPSLRVAMALAGALGMTVEDVFGAGEPGDPVLARPVAPAGPGTRVALATVGDTFVALPLHAETTAATGFGAAGGLIPRHSGTPPSRAAARASEVPVRPIGPPRPTVVVAGCDRPSPCWKPR